MAENVATFENHHTTDYRYLDTKSSKVLASILRNALCPYGGGIPMKPNCPPNRFYLICLSLLMVVLVLGIVQWSFLPILIQNGPISGPSLEMSAGHSSKFAAPFKFLFSDGLQPCIVLSRITVRQITSAIFIVRDVPTYRSDELHLSSHLLRAPPTA
jgi:hypothetical protein